MVFGFGDSSLEKELLSLCVAKNITVSTAESCTGGAIAAKLVTIPGSSAYFKGGIVAYDNSVKENVLKVNPETLNQYGAVSEQTVIEMVHGVTSFLKTDIGVSISGIAGPDGGSDLKPVGTIWIAIASQNHQTTFLLKAGKDRTKNIETATVYTLDLLRRFIQNHY